MKMTLSSLALAAVTCAAINAATPAVASPSDVISIDNGQFVIDEFNGSYTVQNNSSTWYIYAFAVSNPNALSDDPATTYMGTAGTGIVWQSLSTTLKLNGPAEPVNVYLSSFVDQSNGLDNNPGLLAGYVLTDFIAPGETTLAGSFTFNGLPASDAGLLVVDSSGIESQFSTSATPLPAALPLFAGGLGLIGLLARRRKQKCAALAAA